MAATDWSLYGAQPDDPSRLASVSGIFDLRPLMATPMNENLRLTAADAAGGEPAVLAHAANRLALDSWVGGRGISFEFLR
jgi:arylformamidase